MADGRPRFEDLPRIDELQGLRFYDAMGPLRRHRIMEIVERAIGGGPLATEGCTCELCAGHATQGAERRARDLLLSFLDEAQQRDMLNTGKFRMVGSDGVTYVIDTTDYSGNVMEYENGVPIRRFCCYPRYRLGQVPVADRVLGQYLALKTEAPRFKNVAY